MGILKHFGSKNHTRKIDKIRQDFELYQVFMYNYLCEIVPIFPMYILITKRINTFWSGGIGTFWNYTKSSYVPKCFNNPKSCTTNAH